MAKYIMRLSVKKKLHAKNKSKKIIKENISNNFHINIIDKQDLYIM